MCITAVFFICGCKSPQQYKAEADKEAYKLIDSKWTDKLGSRVNYRISDVSPGPNDLPADIQIPPDGVLSLAEAVAVATARNRDYHTQKEALFSTALSLSDIRHQYAQKWFASVDGGYTHNSSDETVDYNEDLGFNQLLADGTSISSDIAVSWLRYLTGDPRTSIGSVFSASITKPLLRGSNRRIVQEGLTQAERNLLYQIRSFNRYRQSFVVTTVSAYYGVLQSLDKVENARRDYQSRVRAYKEAQMLADAGKRTRLQADQTKQYMLQAEDGVARAERAYQQDLDEFKIRLGLATDIRVSLDPNELKSLAEMDIAEPSIPVEDVINTALAYRLDLITSADRFEDAKRKIKVAEDNLGANLNLLLSTSSSSPSGQNDIERIQFQKGTYSAGLSFDLPLDRKNQRNAYRNALINVTQAQRDYALAVDNVKLDVRQTHRQLIEAARRYRIQKESLKLAQDRVKSTDMFLRAGRATARDLLEAQTSLLSAQNETTAVLVAYIGSKLSFYRDTGVLRVRPDGLWENTDGL